MSGEETHAAAAALRSNLEHVKREWPFYWILHINARYAQVLERRLKPLGVDISRWRVLISLYEDRRLSVSEIAEFAVLKLNTTTKIVQRMVADGLVQTRVRPTDGRVTEVSLTEKGKEHRRLALIEAQAVFASSFADVSPQELASLNAILEKVYLQLERM